MLDRLGVEHFDGGGVVVSGSTSDKGGHIVIASRKGSRPTAIIGVLVQNSFTASGNPDGRGLVVVHLTDETVKVAVADAKVSYFASKASMLVNSNFLGARTFLFIFMKNLEGGSTGQCHRRGEKQEFIHDQ